MKKRIVHGIVLVVIAVFAAWMLWPRPLAEAFDGESWVGASVVASGVRGGQLWMDSSEQYDLEHGSAPLAEVLEGYSYHPCWDTMLGDGSMDLKGGTGETVHLHNARDQLLTTGGTSRILLNGRVYRVGYWGNGQGAALNRDILAALRGS